MNREDKLFNKHMTLRTGNTDYMSRSAFHRALKDFASQPTVSEEEDIYDAVISELNANTVNWRGKSVIVSEHYERVAENISESLNVQGDAQQRYEKALQYVERAVHIDGELDQDKALRIAAGLKDKP